MVGVGAGKRNCSVSGVAEGGGGQMAEGRGQRAEGRYNFDNGGCTVDRDLEYEAVAAVVEALPGGDFEVVAGELGDAAGCHE